MARTLARIKEQIAKLQKEADSIQATVVARIKREIAQHGLTADHLFGNATRPAASAGGKRGPAKKAASGEPKYSDGQGNSWHGIGKRPRWIHEALAAGRSLDEFLGGAKPAAAPSTPATEPVVKKAAKRTAQPKRKVPAKKSAAVENTPAKAPVAKKAATPIPLS